MPIELDEKPKIGMKSEMTSSTFGCKNPENNRGVTEEKNLA